MAKQQKPTQKKPTTKVTVGRLKTMSDSLKNQARIDGRIGTSMTAKGYKNTGSLKQDSASNMSKAKRIDSMVSKAISKKKK